MRPYLTLPLLLFILPLFLNGQDLLTPPIKKEIPFASGEILTYQIKYGFVVGGLMTVTLEEALYNKKPVFHAKAFGETTGLANTLYEVKDIYESWFDKVTNLPYKQIRNISEGQYNVYNEVTYNHKKNVVHSKLSGEHKVPENILDLCSAFYYIRRVDFSKISEGTIILVNLYFADELFPFRLRYQGKETIKTKNGRMNCLKISPIVEVGRMFKSDDDMTIWFTDDEKCLPVRVRLELRIVGAVFLKLTKYETASDSTIIHD